MLDDKPKWILAEGHCLVWFQRNQAVVDLSIEEQEEFPARDLSRTEGSCEQLLRFESIKVTIKAEHQPLPEQFRVGDRCAKDFAISAAVSEDRVTLRRILSPLLLVVHRETISAKVFPGTE